MVAESAGVDVSTVSRVLNGPPDEVSRAASRETVKAIREWAARLDYRPNPHAKSLRTARSNLIGVLVPRLSDVVLATIYEGIEDAAARHGLATFVMNSHDRPEKQRARTDRSEEHTSELQSRENLVCRLLHEKKHIPGPRPVTAIDGPTLFHHPAILGARGPGYPRNLSPAGHALQIA